MTCPGCGWEFSSPILIFEDVPDETKDANLIQASRLNAIAGRECQNCFNVFRIYRSIFMAEEKIYNIRISSPFILTQTIAKTKLGIGYKILEIAVEKDLPTVKITDVDSAIQCMMQVGYRALARANHPDLGGDPEVMLILNRAKKELTELFASLKG